MLGIFITLSCPFWPECGGGVQLRCLQCQLHVCYTSTSLVCLLGPTLALTHCRLAVRDAVWRNSPSVASTGPIFRRSEIVTFVTTASRRDGHPRCSIKLCRNDRICNRIQLLAVIYTGVGVGGGVSPSSASASSHSAIFRLKTSFSAAVIF